MKRSHFLRPELWLLCGVLATSVVIAQSSLPAVTPASTNTTIRITAGETLEITTDTSSPASEFSWILTKDRKFLGAQRTRFFQTRLTEPGTYVLDVSVQDPVTNNSSYRAFTVIVSDILPGSGSPFPQGLKDKPLQAVLQTDPVTIHGNAYLPPEGGLLKIDASLSEGPIASYAIDLDTSTDGYGDGDPANDKDNEGTQSERTGSPVFVFMQPSGQQRNIGLTVKDLNQVLPSTTQVSILFGIAPPMPSGSSPSSNGTITMEQNGGDVRFIAQVSDNADPEQELLYRWSFGDGSHSLLHSPVHRYTSPGTYTVELTVQDIRTGDVVYATTDTVNILQGTLPTSSSASSAFFSSIASSEDTETGGGSDISFGAVFRVVLIVLMLIGLAVGMYALLTWFKRKTTNSLQKTLEKMEGGIVKEKPEGIQPEPMKLKKEATVTKSPAAPAPAPEKPKKEFTVRDRPASPPASTSGPVPSWLSNAGKPKAPTPAAAAAPPPTPPVAKPTPAPVAPQPAPTQGPTPPWLKPSTTPAPAPTPTKPTPPATPTSPPAAPKAPAPPVEPKPVDTPKPPAPKPQETPKAPAPPPTPAPAPKLPDTPKPPTPLAPTTPPPPPIPKSDDGDDTIAIIQADSISK